MPTCSDDQWINDQVVSASISQFMDETIVVDASYYLQLFLDNAPYQESLLPALGGLTGIQYHIQNDLDSWKEHKVQPFFIFNGQSVVGADEVTVQRGKRAIAGTDEAWTLYFQSEAQRAVATFLLLYPINEWIIRQIDWEAKTFTAISKKRIIQQLGVTESMFIDALLMAGTTFLPIFPPLKEPSITTRQPPSVQDAVNMLRTSEKSVATACNSFNDILGQSGDPNWLQKYRKARIELAMSLILPRLHRGIQYKPITVRVWYDDKFAHKIEYRPQDPQAKMNLDRAHTWDVKPAAVQRHFRDAQHGSILFEVTALKNADFAKSTITNQKIKGIASTDLVVSTTLWRFLHLRGYVNDKHGLTSWGLALAKSLETLEPTVKKHDTVPGLFEAVLLAYELIRFDLLNVRNQHPELNGLPMQGSDDV
ncbi:hypothetical protein GGR56DRAFT_116948 [Xylariaceae sp. FL0804]|nr:hypothetical protein GGR56DRAFT_116948 [Xylariaceae sp. FL0804]